MAEDTAAAPTPEQVEKALKEYREETDRCAVLQRYSWLASLLNAPKDNPK